MDKEPLTLNQFYQELQQWIDAGFPAHKGFGTHKALCWSLSSWLTQKGVIFNSKRWHDLRQALVDQFVAADLDTDYPFNEGFRSRFVDEEASNMLWCNHERLQWVKQHAS